MHNVYTYRISLQVFREIYITCKFWSHKVNKYWLRWRHWQGVRGGYIFIYIYIYKGQGVKFGVLYYQTFIIHNRYSLIITMIHENHSCLICMIILNHSLKVNKDNLKKPWLYILKSISRITNYSIIFLPQFWRVRLWIVNHHLKIDLLYFLHQSHSTT